MIRLIWNAEDVAIGHIHDYELAVSGESEAVLTGRQSRTTDFEFGLRNQKPLILLLDRSGISRGVHQSCERHLAVRQLEPDGIPELNRRLLAAVEILGRSGLLHFVGAEDVLRRLLRPSRCRQHQYQ